MIRDGEHLGKRVKFRPSFQHVCGETLEGTFVAYIDRPQVVIELDDGDRRTVAAELVTAVARIEWDAP